MASRGQKRVKTLWLNGYVTLRCPHRGCMLQVKLSRKAGKNLRPPEVEVSPASRLVHNHPPMSAVAASLLPGNKGFPKELEVQLASLAAGQSPASAIYDHLVRMAQVARVPVSFTQDMVKNLVHKLRNNTSTDDAIRLWHKLVEQSLMNPDFKSLDIRDVHNRLTAIFFATPEMVGRREGSGAGRSP